MFSWPIILAATNLAPERSIIPSCSGISTRSDTAAGLAANTSRRLPPLKASDGTRHKQPTHSHARIRKIKMIDVGFIGLGIMGRPMAGHLQTAGHRLFLHDVGPIAPELVAAGGVVCESGREVAEESDAIIVMVPDTPHVEAVLFGSDGVAEGLSKGKTVVDMSSISPLATKEFAKKINAHGADYLDAPVSGGEVGAKAASLTIMVGGPERAFNAIKPLFEKMGKNVTLVGGNGDGQTTKVANQIIVALTIEAVGEALLFASKAGADPALVRQALMGG